MNIRSQAESANNIGKKFLISGKRREKISPRGMGADVIGDVPCTSTKKNRPNLRKMSAVS